MISCPALKNCTSCFFSFSFSTTFYLMYNVWNEKCSTKKYSYSIVAQNNSLYVLCRNNSTYYIFTEIGVSRNIDKVTELENIPDNKFLET